MSTAVSGTCEVVSLEAAATADANAVTRHAEEVRPALPAPDEFLTRLFDSRLLTPAEVEEFLEQQPSVLEGRTAGLVRALVGQGMLTRFQVEHLLRGQTAGLVLGNYRLRERIGAGGMGVVYRAEHVYMKRPAAVKVIAARREVESAFLRRFAGEIQAASALNHPHIVQAFDAGAVELPPPSEDVLHYLAMEYVPGQNLEQHVKARGLLPVALACDYVRQAAHGLQHAHEHGLVHRDIKPSNLLLTPEGQVKIVDFGVARFLRRRLTEVHSTLGTVDYMAPEQARDARRVDIRADIYALGGILYFLLSGRQPFPPGRSALEELFARQHESPAPLRTLRADVPLELEAIVCQMMARDPGDRYATPLAVIAALNGLLEPAAVTLSSARGVASAERVHCLESSVADVNRQLEQALRLRQADFEQAQEVLVYAVSQTAVLRGHETPGHLVRMQGYSRALAEEAMRRPAFAGRIDNGFVRTLERCVALHDVGKAAIPDHILLKPGRLEPEERLVMESHTTVGAELVAGIARRLGRPLPLLQMAVDVVRHHHEHFDGTGYPDGRVGEEIPLAARIVAIADTYDALRSRLVYKPGVSHAAARRLLLENGAAGRFDPALLDVFRQIEGEFEQIFTQTPD